MRRIFVFAPVTSLCLACGADDPVEQGPDASTDAGADVTTDVADTSDVLDTTSDAACVEACSEVAGGAADECGADELATFESACVALCSGETAQVIVTNAELVGGDVPDAYRQWTAWLSGVGATCDNGGCGLAAGLYDPEAGGTEWAGESCVSDDGSYVQVEENVSTIGRVAAYEQMAELLWRSADVPTPDDFVAARELYAADEGLDSRLQRREDEHYAAATDAEGNPASCRDAGIPELNPERCAGPALILPVVNQAFQDGINGVEPRLAAARLEGALLWFLYLSVYKEARTCSVAAKDCDSSWAYYGGGEQRDGGLGLAGEILAVSPAAHDAIFDGLLAVRCWRDIDAEPTSTDAELYDRATGQLDRALQFGYARLILDRLAQYTLAAGEERAILGAFLEVAGPPLARRLAEADAGLATAFEGALAADEIDSTVAATSVLSGVRCPY